MALVLRFSMVSNSGVGMIEVRFHGRGGQGAKLAIRILGLNAEIHEPSWRAVPYLGTAEFARPMIRYCADAVLLTTGGCRPERAVMDLATWNCCFLCYLYCGAGPCEENQLATALSLGGAGRSASKDSDGLPAMRDTWLNIGCKVETNQRRTNP